MRSYIMIALSVFVLGALNYSIYDKQKIKDHGEVVFLKLGSYDPRSIMQGDYRRLGYALLRAIPKEKKKKFPKRGYVVIKPDENNVAQFVRLHVGAPLKEEEKLLRFHKKHYISIVPDTFFFQEGHDKYYKKIEYGVFKFDKKGNYLLVGLADKDKKTISPINETSL